ncbi:hydrogenase [Rhodospirillum rubrum]|uniref:respiratory chain complex I subunit 1 family protein n=1 Tax=Rhodospirillum rubrum TaxID=1085 RepID=UPI0019031C46|nr:complex I subunit 1 family protein [Rhodospirillum rubrum]MBK1662908.1 hydrogenase [Rhodospirillum rubrum]MBK1677094.1 hydrogenase [Rhodospirillum rubrum]
MTDSLVQTLSVLFAAVVFPGGIFAITLGLALKGFDRRVFARLQRRVGAPLLQPFYDVLKLMTKRTLVPENANLVVFLMVPLLGLASMGVAAAMIPIPGLYDPSPAFGDLLVLFYLLSVPAVMLMLAGSASGSPFGGIGFSREMAIMLAYEGPILLVIVSVALKTGAALGQPICLSLSEIVRYQQVHGAYLFDPWMWPAVLTYIAFIPANLGISPFDIPEAESEVLEGPLIEYSGVALGLLKLTSAVKSVVVIGLGIVLFFPNGPEGLFGLVVFALKCLVITVCGVSVLRAAVGRMRIDQAVIFYLKWPELLGIASLALVAMNL